MAVSETKAPRSADRLLGQRIRQVRLMADLTQSELGDAIGVTFQQVQKYELGMNRVSVSRLQDIAKAFGVSASSFLPESQADAFDARLASRAYSKDTLLVLDAFEMIRSSATRRRIRDLISAIVDAEGAHENRTESDSVLAD